MPARHWIAIAGLLLLLPGTVAAQDRPTPAALLNLRFPEISFQAAPLDEVFDFIAEMTDINLVVRWERLADLGIERDTPITIRVRNLRLSQVLWIVMNEATPDGGRLGYRLDRDLLLITTAEQLGQEMIVRVYDVRDMLQPEIANPSFTYGRVRTYVAGATPQVAEGAVGVQPVTDTIQSGGRFEGTNPGGSIFIPREGDDVFNPGQSSGGGGGEPDVGAFSDQRMQQLISVIENTIEPESWQANGGRGSVRAYNGFLIIRNTPLVHQQIGTAP